jgi:hypothetical protein
MITQELCGLKSFRELGFGGVFDDPGPSEADSRRWLSQD